jgi:hypothetical protein
MKMTSIEVPEDLFALLQQALLGTRPCDELIRMALAILLFQQGVVSDAGMGFARSRRRHAGLSEREHRRPSHAAVMGLAQVCQAA